MDTHVNCGIVTPKCSLNNYPRHRKMWGRSFWTTIAHIGGPKEWTLKQNLVIPQTTEGKLETVLVVNRCCLVLCSFIYMYLYCLPVVNSIPHRSSTPLLLHLGMRNIGIRILESVAKRAKVECSCSVRRACHFKHYTICLWVNVHHWVDCVKHKWFQTIYIKA